MAAGIKVLTDTGRVILDTSIRTGSFVAEVTTTSTPGSFAAPIPPGEFFYYVIPLDAGKIPPIITYQDGRIHWAAPSGFDLNPALVMYGAF